jgi:hypothetical protein
MMNSAIIERISSYLALDGIISELNEKCGAHVCWYKVIVVGALREKLRMF